MRDVLLRVWAVAWVIVGVLHITVALQVLAEDFAKRLEYSIGSTRRLAVRNALFAFGWGLLRGLGAVVVGASRYTNELLGASPYTLELLVFGGRYGFFDFPIVACYLGFVAIWIGDANMSTWGEKSIQSSTLELLLSPARCDYEWHGGLFWFAVGFTSAVVLVYKLDGGPLHYAIAIGVTAIAFWYLRAVHEIP